MSDKNNTTSTEEEVLKTGTEGTGTEGTGTEGTGAEGAGTEGTGAEGTGTEGTGAEGTGTEGTGAETEGTGAEESESCTGATEKMRLVAVYPILFESHQYKPGDVLPTHNLDMNDAWLAAGTAVWKTEDGKAVKAVPASAQAGLAGTAVPASTEDLVGRVPNSGAKGKGKKK